MSKDIETTDVEKENESPVSQEFSNFFPTSRPIKRKMKKKKVYRIGFAYNARAANMNGESNDSNLEFDEIETIDAIKHALEILGYEVIPLEADINFIENLKNSNVDFVFNIAEGIHGESRESHIPAILEMFGIPYSGSGVLIQAVTLSKSIMKEILRYNGIRTPPFQLFKTPNEKLKKSLKFPLLVKPDAEGSSIGITNESLVFDEKQLRIQVKKILAEHLQPALVEDYCTGREFTVGLIGNERPKVLPIIEVTFDHLPQGMAKIDSYESKWVYDTPEMDVSPLICPAKISMTLRKTLETVARKTYKTLRCVDFSRIDIRLNSKGIPMVLDVNTLPGLNPDPAIHSRFPLACSVAGMEYDEMIRSVLQTAFKRYKLH